MSCVLYSSIRCAVQLIKSERWLFGIGCKHNWKWPQSEKRKRFFFECGALEMERSEKFHRGASDSHDGDLFNFMCRSERLEFYNSVYQSVDFLTNNIIPVVYIWFIDFDDPTCTKYILSKILNTQDIVLQFTVRQILEFWLIVRLM